MRIGGFKTTFCFYGKKFHLGCMKTTERVRIDYKNRIYKVVVYIENNIHSDLRLEVLAEIANFSPFHFHRLFSAIYGESLGAYVIRKRIERSALHLLRRTSESISEIGSQYGFENPSSFTRAFKKRFKMSPTEFLLLNEIEISKICIVDRKNGQDDPNREKYICAINNLKNWLKMNAEVQVKEIPTRKVACIRKSGPYTQLGGAFEKLMGWARTQMDITDELRLTWYHDNPKLTDIEVVEWSACVTLSDEVDTNSDIQLAEIPGGKYAVGRFQISSKDFSSAWESMSLWMVENGYHNCDSAPFEIYHSSKEEHHNDQFDVEICMPIELN